MIALIHLQILIHLSSNELPLKHYVKYVVCTSPLMPYVKLRQAPSPFPTTLPGHLENVITLKVKWNNSFLMRSFIFQLV